MAGWIYVLELSPPGYVKVGQTTCLEKRLKDHILAVGMSGAAVTRVFSVACENTEMFERQILKQVAELPRSATVNGREIFAGVTFLEVATIADRLAGNRYRRVRPAADLAVARDLLADVHEALSEDVSVRAADMAARLRELAPGYPGYMRITGTLLAKRLSTEGVAVTRTKGFPTVWADRVRRALDNRRVAPRPDTLDDPHLTLVEGA